MNHRRPLPVYGDGQNVRDWLFVDDHCRAIDLVLNNAWDTAAWDSYSEQPSRESSAPATCRTQARFSRYHFAVLSMPSRNKTRGRRLCCPTGPHTASRSISLDARIITDLISIPRNSFPTLTVPPTLVETKTPGEAIERSTWDSAAKFITASMSYSPNLWYVSSSSSKRGSLAERRV